MSQVKQLWDLLEGRERWQLLGLGAAMLLAAVVETLGVASILPFMRVVSDQRVIESDRWLHAVYDIMGFTSERTFLVWAGVALVMLIALANSVGAVTTWLTQRYTWAQNHRFCLRLLRTYLNRPYSHYLGHNTAGLNRTLLQEVQTVVNGVLLPGLTVMARGAVTVMIIGLLGAVDPHLTLVITLVLGGSYGGIYLYFRRQQLHLGRERLANNTERFKVAGEAFGGIKMVKCLNREDEFVRRFSRPSWRFSMATASNKNAGSLPRYALETIAFGGVLIILLYFMLARRDVGAVLPLLSLYAFAGYRLMPSLNQLFGSIVQLRFNHPSLDVLHADLAGPRGPVEDARSARKVFPPTIEWSHKIELDHVSYSYAGSARLAIRDVSLVVPRNSSVALVGPTGAGKTTIVDVLLGLLEPQRGQLRVDGIVLARPDLQRWRTGCGYVPQDIFLCDDTVANNIAFGLPDRKIDREEVVRAACIAQIHDFIESLPNGYDTTVGERGVRLSGGQRQRIGIARALYGDPPLLVMDEATSSLDGATEGAVIETINHLVQRKTILVIAHRLSTVQRCDHIYVIEDGAVVTEGTYERLSRWSDVFRAMAGVASLAGARPPATD